MENLIDGSRRIRPVFDTVLVKLEPPPRTSSLIVEPNLKYRPIDGAWGTVVAVGDRDYHRYCAHCKRPFAPIDAELQVGDRVLMDSSTAGDAVLLDGVEHRLVRASELLAVVEREDEAEAAQ